MQNNQDDNDISFDFYHDIDLMRCIGISSQKEDSQNIQYTQKIELKRKLLSKLQFRKQSMTVASQKLFEFKKPNIINKCISKRKVSFGFFSQKDLDNKNNILSIHRRSRIIKSETKLELRPEFSNIKIKDHSNWSTDISQAPSMNIQKALKIKQRLRKSNYNSRNKLISNSTKKLPSIKDSVQTSRLKSFIFQTNIIQPINQDYNPDKQRFKIIKNFKKSHLIKRRSYCKPIQQLSSERTNLNNYSYPEFSRLSVTGRRVSNQQQI